MNEIAMSETKTEKIYTRISKSLDKLLKIRAAQSGLKLPDAFEEAIRLWVSASNSADVSPSVAEARAAVVLDTGVMKYWGDRRYRKVIADLVTIWDSGDVDVMNALALNCAQFRRIGELLQGSAHGDERGTRVPEDSSEHERRGDAYARQAFAIETGDTVDAEEVDTPPESRERVRPVGKRSIRKTEHGGSK